MNNDNSITVFLVDSTGSKEGVCVQTHCERPNAIFGGIVARMHAEKPFTWPSTFDDAMIRTAEHIEPVMAKVFGENWKRTHKRQFHLALRDCVAVFDAVSKTAGWQTEAVEFQPAEDVVMSMGFPRFWELLKFLLGSKNRERLFAPAYNDLLADHLESQLPKYQTTWTRRWIRCCFAIRTAGLVVQCMAVGLRGAAAGVVVPVAVREAVMKWWYGG